MERSTILCSKRLLQGYEMMGGPKFLMKDSDEPIKLTVSVVTSIGVSLVKTHGATSVSRLH